MSASTRTRLAREIDACVSSHGSDNGADVAELRALVTSALQLDYVSESCRGGIQTGNHYQSVRIGDSVTTGFRSDRAEVLDQIDFRGRTVWDLGSNLGELSRAARERGAARVVGIEYDEFFVAVARGLNVLNGVDEVEFRQGDIGDPQIYGEHFDIVLAFSVFQYVGPVIEKVCGVTDELLVVETHKLDGNLVAHYIEPVSRHIPSFKMLGRSDWGAIEEPGERAVVAFARSEKALSRSLHGGQASRERAPERVSVNVRLTSRELKPSFFTLFNFDSLDELLAAVGTTSIDLTRMVRNRDVDLAYRGWLYWFMYLKGYLDYSDRGTVDAENPYCRYMSDVHLLRVEEPGVREEDVLTIVLRRYRDLDAIREAAAVGDRPDLLPIRITVSDPMPRYPLPVLLESGDRIEASLVDGWHRIFAAAICAVPELEADLVREGYPPIDGRVERFEVLDHGATAIDGWCLNPEQPWDFLEVRAGGEPLARVDPRPRPDLAQSFPDVPHAGASGLSFSLRGLPDDDRMVELLPMRNWLPVGRIRLYRPPDSQASRTTLALATSIGEALHVLRPIVSAETTVAVGPATGELVAALAPDVDVRVVEGDPETWQDLPLDVGIVVAGDALAAMPEAVRPGWLRRVAEATPAGAMIALRDKGWLPPTIPNELRRFARLQPEPVEASETVVLLRTE